MDRKQFSPEDRLRLRSKPSEGESPSPLPAMPCIRAHDMAVKFETGMLTIGEQFVLGLHVVDSDMIHEDICLIHNRELTERVLSSLRSAHNDENKP